MPCGGARVAAGPVKEEVAVGIGLEAELVEGICVILCKRWYECEAEKGQGQGQCQVYGINLVHVMEWEWGNK